MLVWCHLVLIPLKHIPVENKETPTDLKPITAHKSLNSAQISIFCCSTGWDITTPHSSLKLGQIELLKVHS